MVSFESIVTHISLKLSVILLPRLIKIYIHIYLPNSGLRLTKLALKVSGIGLYYSIATAYKLQKHGCQITS